MPLIRNALSAVLGDQIASSDERSLRRNAKRMEKDARKANRHNSASATVITVQALQTQLTYETVREQRFVRLGDMGQAERCQAVIAALRQQLAAYQPMAVAVQQPYFLQQQQPYSMSAVPTQSYATYPAIQQQQPPQYAAAVSYNAGAAAAQPVSYSAPPPTYTPHSASDIDSRSTMTL